MTIPREFFTVQSMLTLTGATGATYLVCSGLQRAFDFNPKWLALLVAMIISIFGVFMSQPPLTPPSVADCFVGVINGFLIYATASGTSAIAGSTAKARGQKRAFLTAGSSVPQEKRGFFTSWF